MAPAARALLVAVLLALPLAGCVEIVVARVPDRLLEGPGGNGWAKNQTASQAEPTGGRFSFTKTQALVYEDKGGGDGYPGVLVVTTLRAVPSPSGERIREHVEKAIREEATRRGIALQGAPQSGARDLANGETSTWFVYVGNVTSEGFFERAAEVRIFGEVFECAAHKTVVASVGLAQVTDVRSVVLPGVGSVPQRADRDTTTWREVVGDPSGRVDGVRGGGLAYQVEC